MSGDGGAAIRANGRVDRFQTVVRAAFATAGIRMFSLGYCHGSNSKSVSELANFKPGL